MKNIQIIDTNRFTFESGKDKYSLIFSGEGFMVERMEDNLLISDRKAKIIENKLKKL